MTDKPKKRIVLPSKRGEIPTVVASPTVETLMEDVMSIIGNEIARYKAKSTRGVTLDLKEARVVQAYMDTLVKLSKEERERARAEDLTNLSDEELKQLAAEVLKVDFKNGESE